MALFIAIVAWIVFIFLFQLVHRIREARKYRKTKKKTHPLRKETKAWIEKVDGSIVSPTCNAGNRGIFFHRVGTGKPKHKTNKIQLSKITKLKHKKKNY